MRITILASGTRGDIQPMLAVGDELARRGHSVTVTVNRNLVPWARRSGLGVFEVDLDYERFFKSAAGQAMLAKHGGDAVSKSLQELERRSNRSLSQAFGQACHGADLIVSTILTCYRGTIVAEKLGIPHGIALTFPVFPTASWTHSSLPMRTLGVGVLNLATFWAVDGGWWRASRTNFDQMRAMLDLEPCTDRPRVEDLPCALLYSERMVPRPPDWPQQHVFCGYATLPSELRARLGEQVDPRLERWLAAGERPIFFGFGSMPILEPTTMLRQIAEVTAARGVRGLIGAGWTDYTAAGQLPEHLFVAPSLDHERILPRCRAAIHHGGAGTTAAVARAGLPSLVASVFGDQPFWGWRIRELEVGTTMPFQKLTAAKIDRALDTLLDEATQARAQTLAAGLQTERGAERAATVIESWATEPVDTLAREAS